MKIRIASSLAVAAGLVLGTSGCNLIAPQATLEQYAPSDGIELSLDGVDLLNVLLIADEGGESFNVVFNSVNLTGAPLDLAIQFVGESGQQATAEVTIPEGTTIFGNPALDQEIVVVDIPNLMVGSTIEAFFQISGLDEEQRFVPVLDGTLKDYEPLVLPADFQTDAEEGEAGSDDSDAEAAAGSDSE